MSAIVLWGTASKHAQAERVGTNHLAGRGRAEEQLYIVDHKVKFTILHIPVKIKWNLEPGPHHLGEV